MKFPNEDFGKFQPEFDVNKFCDSGIFTNETFEYHYGKHHCGYARKLKDLINGTQFAQLESLEDVIIASRATNPKVFNNAAQLFNHNFFWKCLTNERKQPTEKLNDLIVAQYGTVADFQQQYIDAADTAFGSGWSWIVYDKERQLRFVNSQNAETPIGTDDVPICVIDLWEHAYYIDFRNDRRTYIQKIVENFIDWDFCSKQIAVAESK